MRSLRVLAVILVVALAGCATPVQPGPPAPAPTVTSSAPGEAEQQRETGLTRPALVFDGDCAQLFTDAELSSVMGATLPLVPNHFTELWGGDAFFNQNGGFECTWTGEAGRVIALVLPEAATQYTATTECGLEEHDTGLMTCDLEAVANGIRLSGMVALGLDPIAAAAGRDALRAIFEAKAATATPVLVPLPAVGSWTLPPDCIAIGDAADFSAVPGLGAGAVGGEGGGYGKDISQAERALEGDWSPMTCSINGESVWLEYVSIGGARWREEAIAARADASPLTLDGVDAAYGVPYLDGKTLVYAFSGPNMLVFAVTYPKNAAGIATALIASLDTTAVS